MTVSKSRLQSYVKFIKSDAECFAAINERLQKVLFDRWTTATDEEADVIRGIHSNQMLFITELNKVFESITEDEPVNDTEEGQDNG